MKAPLLRWVVVVTCLAGCAVAVGPARAVTFQLDYRYDDGFFTNTVINPQADAARAALEYAAGKLGVFLDGLSAIQPSGSNTWDAIFWRPDAPWDDSVSIHNMVVPADTVVVFAGGANLGATLGLGGPGGFSSYGTSAWNSKVAYRGQSGAALPNPTDFGPWGGSVSFNSTTSWSYGIADGLIWSWQSDFVSVAMHELCHVLGIGTAGSWDTYVQSAAHEFTGPAATAAFGGDVPLDNINAHWLSGTESLTGTVTEQEAAMDPELTTGTRKWLTALDLAGLVDVGWEMPLLGDADRDGAVDYEDYVTLKRAFGSTGALWGEGDFDFDGDVDYYDYAALRDSFGLTDYWAGGELAAAPAGVIPEPATLALLAAGALAGLRRRR